MHCNSCVKIIQEQLLELDGVESVEADFAQETVEVSFYGKKTSLTEIEGEIENLGYTLNKLDSKAKSASKPLKKTSVKEGIIYGLVPHIGCIGFIIASILGATIAVEFFKPLLMNPWFFHILVLISIGFATLSSVFYLNKNGILSLAGLKRKKKYLATMYGATVGINLVLFLVVFPMIANLDTGSFANANAAELASDGSLKNTFNQLSLQVNIPCPGHAPLITGELKTIEGVTGVRFEFPNNFDVAFDSSKTNKKEILALEVFETYPAKITSEPEENTSSIALKKVEATALEAPSSGTTCSAGESSCGGSGCGCGSCGAR